MANLIKKFANDTKLPTKAELKAAAASAPAKVAAPAKKAAATTTKKDAPLKAAPAKKVKADGEAPALVTLLLPQGSEIVPHKGQAGVNWAKTPHLEGHRFPHWFRDDKYAVTNTKKGITVTVPRSVAASKGMMDYAQK